MDITRRRFIFGSAGVAISALVLPLVEEPKTAYSFARVLRVPGAPELVPILSHVRLVGAMTGTGSIVKGTGIVRARGLTGTAHIMLHATGLPPGTMAEVTSRGPDGFAVKVLGVDGGHMPVDIREFGWAVFG